MSETTSGPGESLGVEARLDKLNATLDEWEKKQGLPPDFPAEVEHEARELLRMLPQTLKRLTATECGEGAFTLLQYAFFLQRVANKAQGEVRAAEEMTKRLVASHLSQQRAYSYQERMLLALKENDAATKADNLRMLAQARLDRVSYLSSKAESLARSLMSLQNSKRRENS